MLARLDRALAELPALLDTPQVWRSLDIDYHPPRVERLYCSYGEGRLYLHRIHPCPAGAALLHPHPWPCAVAVLAGRYEMGVAYGAGDDPPPVAARILAEAPLRYEMVEPDAWHHVRPLGGPALSVMITGAPWPRSSPRPERPLSALRPAAVEDLRAACRAALSRYAD